MAHVLLVEDDAAEAGLVADLLGAYGHVVTAAGSGAEARRLVREAPPGLVILDLLLPDADGLVLCGEIRDRSDVPIIVCSGTARDRDRVLALKLGADDFIAKPFEPWEFEARVEAVLRRSRAGQLAGARR